MGLLFSRKKVASTFVPFYLPTLSAHGSCLSIPKEKFSLFLILVAGELYPCHFRCLENLNLISKRTSIPGIKGIMWYRCKMDFWRETDLQRNNGAHVTHRPLSTPWLKPSTDGHLLRGKVSIDGPTMMLSHLYRARE